MVVCNIPKCYYYYYYYYYYYCFKLYLFLCNKCTDSVIRYKPMRRESQNQLF